MDEAAEEQYRQAEHALWRSLGASDVVEHVVDLPWLGSSVRIQEVGNGPPVLFVHGGSNGGTSWAPLAARLEGWRCLVLDRPGCGLSEPHPTGHREVAELERFADHLVADVLDALGVERAPVVATSFGGYFALRSAAARPDRIEQVVEIGWSMGAPISKTPMPMRLAAVGPIAKVMTSVPIGRRAARMMFKQIGLGQALAAGRITDEMTAWFMAMMNHTDTLRNELDAMPPLITLRDGMNDDLLLGAELRGGIEVPVRFLWGDGDPMGGADTARAFVEPFADAELVMAPGAGHAPWIDDPDGVADQVRAWLAAVAPG